MGVWTQTKTRPTNRDLNSQLSLQLLDTFTDHVAKIGRQGDREQGWFFEAVKERK